MNALESVFAQPIAHRGLHHPSTGPIENSAAAFIAAIDKSFAIECDIQLTGDDQPVVFHDYKLDRLTAQKGRLKQISAEQFRRIPVNGSSDQLITFEEFLNLVDGRTPLIVELKSQFKRNHIMAKKVVEAAKNYHGPLVFKSSDAGLIIELRKSGCTHAKGMVIKRKMSRRAKWMEGIVLKYLLHYPWTRFDFLSCKVDDLEMPHVRFLRAIGYKVMTWTVRTQSARAAAALHADQIIFEGEIGKELNVRTK